MTKIGTFERGIHPKGEKHLAKVSSIEVLPLPKRVMIPLLQHTGAPNEPLHKPASVVALGDMVGSSQSFVSAAIHASISGKTSLPTSTTLPNGRRVKCVLINQLGDQPQGQAIWDDTFGGDWSLENLEQYSPLVISQSACSAGLVGLGGAAFPTHVKFKTQEKKPIDTVLINGCECEPYLTADESLMTQAPLPIVVGSLLAKIAVNAARVIVCIEKNKPEAINRIREAAKGTSLEVMGLETKYPQGCEKQLLPAVLGRVVPTGGLPLDAGVVVINVGTAAALARAVMRKKPLTHRVMTVTGRGVKNPKNVLVPIGVSYGEVIDYCGGLTSDAARVVAGGPMTGFTIGSLDTPVTKGTSGVTILTRDEITKLKETSCIRCGRCVDVCPINLVPTKLALASRHRDWDLARKYHLMSCMECGSCAFVCPAGLPLTQLLRMGKAMLPK